MSDATERTVKDPVRFVSENGDHWWCETFLRVLASTGNVRHACRKTGISRKAAYDFRMQNRLFAEAWQEALDDALDEIEYQARRRALRDSDTMAQFLLKAYRPDTFDRPRRMGAEGNPQGMISYPIDLKGLSDKELADFEKLLTKAAVPGDDAS